MKKTMIVFGILACVALLVNPAMACDGDKAKSASNEASSCDKAAAAQASNDGSSCSKIAAVTASNEGATCSKSAAKAAYTQALNETGCEKTAQAAYASITTTAGASCDVAGAGGKGGCSKSTAETTSDKVADANTKLASNEEGSSR